MQISRNVIGIKLAVHHAKLIIHALNTGTPFLKFNYTLYNNNRST